MSQCPRHLESLAPLRTSAWGFVDDRASADSASRPDQHTLTYAINTRPNFDSEILHLLTDVLKGPSVQTEVFPNLSGGQLSSLFRSSGDLRCIVCRNPQLFKLPGIVRCSLDEFIQLPDPFKYGIQRRWGQVLKT